MKNKFFKILAKISQFKTSPHTYRVLSIEKDAQNDYVAVVQMINSRSLFKMKPEEILADDNMTDSFSQRDIRTLTYLGYLDMNSPKYKILAKRLSETDNKLVFAIQEKGKKKPIIKTAEELSHDEVILSSLHQKDAHLVGYTVGSETSTSEQALIKRLVKEENAKKIDKKE